MFVYFLCLPKLLDKFDDSCPIDSRTTDRILMKFGIEIGRLNLEKEHSLPYVAKKSKDPNEYFSFGCCFNN
jgi:hypothetical protein